jgi:hypothetical protein
LLRDAILIHGRSSSGLAFFSLTLI